MKNLCRGRYLPVEVSAAELHGQSKHPGPLRGYAITNKCSLRKVSVKVLSRMFPAVFINGRRCCNGICQLIEKIYLKLLEERDGEPGKKGFQVSAGTFKPEPVEVRKCDAHPDGVYKTIVSQRHGRDSRS
jgi:hypothetical protein